MSTKFNLSLFRASSNSGIISTYSDLDANPITDKTALAIDLRAVQQSLDNLFSTKQYERPFLPDYYSPVWNLIGELATEEAAYALSSAVYNKITRYEPRVIYDNANSTYEAMPDKNGFVVNVVFRLVGDITGNSYNYNTTVYTIT